MEADNSFAPLGGFDGWVPMLYHDSPGRIARGSNYYYIGYAYRMLPRVVLTGVSSSWPEYQQNLSITKDLDATGFRLALYIVEN